MGDGFKDAGHDQKGRCEAVELVAELIVGVDPAGASLTVGLFPQEAGRVDDGAEDDGIGQETEQTGHRREETQRQRLISLRHAPAIGHFPPANTHTHTHTHTHTQTQTQTETQKETERNRKKQK